MRVGRKFKSLLLVCVTMLPVLYVFYAKDDYTGSGARFTVLSKENEQKTKDKSKDPIFEVLEVLTEGSPPSTDRSDNDTYLPERPYAQTLSKWTPNASWTDDPTWTSRNTDVMLVNNHIKEDGDQKSRVRNLHLSCARQSTDGCKDLRKCNLTEFFFSKHHNFAYCKVPKSGSTFWMKLFLVLYNGERYLRLMNTWSRSDVHSRSRRLVTPPMKIYRNKIPTIIVSRNPYSRLFSAYTDKVFMPLFWNYFKKMQGVKLMKPFFVNRTVDAFKKNNAPIPQRLVVYKDQMAKRGMIKKLNMTTKVTPVCANNVTFEDFLKFVIAEAKAGKILEPHWAPISSLCRPCLFNTQYIIKQENFSHDVEKFLEAFKINSTGLEVVKNELFDRRVENSIPGIVGVIERKASTQEVKVCIPRQEIVKRLWTSFQIQGYINANAEIPGEILSENFSRFKFTSKILDLLQRESLTPEQRSYQRRSYLIKAYRHIGPEIIREIQEIYRSDFELFNYPIQPPVW